MKFDVEHISSVKKKISIVVPSEKVGEKIDRAYGRLKMKAKIKGFRPGKAPRSVLEKYYRDQVIEEVLNEAIQESYSKVLEEEEINPVSYPHFGGEELREGEDFAFSLTVDVKPKPDIKDYSGVELKKEKVEVKDEEIAAELEKLRKSLAAYSPVDERGIEKGDYVTFDFEGFVGDEPLENGKAENYTLEIGSASFIPGFEDQMTGLRKGEEGEVKVRFPDDYHVERLSGKEAVFKVKVKEIKCQDLPPLDDEFAKDAGDYDSLDELKERISTDIREEREQKERNRLERELIDRILEKNPFDVPESMLERQVYYKNEEIRNRMLGFGMKPEEVEGNLIDMKDEIRTQAESEVKGGLLLESVAEKEGIKVEDEDVEAHYRELAERSGRTSGEIRSYYEDKKSYLMSSLMDKKVLDFLMDRAKIAEG